jgi:lipoprotein-anchoring transpeptidase ErfK/SrfK
MDIERVTRRGVLIGGLTLIAGCVPKVEQVIAPVSSGFTFDPRYEKQSVEYQTDEQAGSIVVDTSERFLYFVEGDGRATRYGVGVGEEGLTLKGRATVGRKAEWPSWTPTAAMLKRKPRLLQYAGGVPGGPDNPLGARALYLYRGAQDTKFRVHGTNEPWTIGHAVSNGCIRMFNDDVIELYDRAPLGTPVLVT